MQTEEYQISLASWYKQNLQRHVDSLWCLTGFVGASGRPVDELSSAINLETIYSKASHHLQGLHLGI